MRPSTSGQRGLDKSDTGSIIDKISSLNKLEASSKGSKGKENKKSKMKSTARRDEPNESAEFEAQVGPKSAPPLSRTVNEILGDDLGDANDDALPYENQLNADFNDNYDDFKELNFNASTDYDDDNDELNDDDEWDTDMEPEGIFKYFFLQRLFSRHFLLAWSSVRGSVHLMTWRQWNKISNRTNLGNKINQSRKKLLKEARKIWTRH